MSSLFSQASLVVEPAVYEDGLVYATKPFDGSGDLTFTRSNDTATRVNSAGLIEKVRTNLALQSNTFSDAAWSKVGAALTSGKSGYDGTNNAWLLTKSAPSGRIEQSLSTLSSASNTLSVYVKANASTWCAIEYNTSYRYLNLTTGAVSSGGGGYSVQSVGNGWYRLSINNSSSSGAFRIYPAEADDISSSSGSIFIQNSQVETGDIATEPITTLASAVSVGPVANLPRLDYSGGATCPSLLLEGQRQNLVTFSEQIDNATWTKDGTTATANQTASPSGYADADLVTNNGVSGDHTIYQTISLSATTYTVSAYVKKNTESYVHLTLNRGADATEWATATFNLDTATSANYSSVLSTPSSTITAFGTDGWYRVTMTCTLVNAANTILLIGFAKAGAPDTSRGRYVTVNTNSFYIWGAQVEAGAYATSYIPTLGAAVTRGADAASKTGISSLIGQTEGTLFLELDIIAGTPVYHTLMQVYGNNDNRIGIGQDLNSTNVFMFINGSGTSSYQVATVAAGPHKIALAYKNGDSVLYIDGVAAITTTRAISLSIPLSTLFLNNVNGNEIGIFKDSQALLFKTRLSNADLATLTTI